MCNLEYVFLISRLSCFLVGLSLCSASPQHQESPGTWSGRVGVQQHWLMVVWMGYIHQPIKQSGFPHCFAPTGAWPEQHTIFTLRREWLWPFWQPWWAGASRLMVLKRRVPVIKEARHMSSHLGSQTDNDWQNLSWFASLLPLLGMNVSSGSLCLPSWHCDPTCLLLLLLFWNRRALVPLSRSGLIHCSTTIWWSQNQ